MAGGPIESRAGRVGDLAEGREAIQEDQAEPGMGPSEETRDLVGLYLRQASETPLLTAEEEVHLAQTIEAGREADSKLRTQQATLSRQEQDQFKAMKRQGEKARDSFIRANTRLVISIAKRYRGRGVAFPDLIQEGNIGLIRAVEKFDYRRGYKFSTYATWWIRQSIVRGIADEGRTIRLPDHIGDSIKKLHRTARRLAQEDGGEPTAGAIAQVMGVDVSDLERLIEIGQRTFSLDTPVGDESETIVDLIVEEGSDPAVRLLGMMLSEELEELLFSITAREARVLELRFGLNGREPHTLEEVGNKFGLTKERIRQIEQEALAKLRGRGIKLRDFLE